MATLMDINSVARRIITGFFRLNIAKKFYGRRYVILKSQEMLSLFWSKSKEFDNIVEHMLSIPDQKDIPADTLNSLHTEYNNVFVKGFEHLGKPSSTPARDFDDRVQAK